MLGDRDATATVAVKDLQAAKKFYEGKLGLKRTGPEDPESLVYTTGKTQLFVYRSEYAGTNQATAVTWGVGPRFDELVRGLGAKGVTFERYDLPGTTREGDVHVTGELKVAWFKDPDGNIHSLVNQ